MIKKTLEDFGKKQEVSLKIFITGNSMLFREDILNLSTKLEKMNTKKIRTIEPQIMKKTTGIPKKNFPGSYKKIKDNN